MRPNRRTSPVTGKRLLVGVMAFALHSAIPRRGQAEVCEGLCWSAPTGCPSQSDVVARIQRLAEGRFVFEGRAWIARVTNTEHSWLLELSHGEHRRDIVAHSCAALADAAAVAIVLSEPPRANGTTQPVSSEPGTAPSSPPAADVPLVDQGAGSAGLAEWSEAAPSPTPRGAELTEPGEPERPPAPPVAQRRVEPRTELHAPKQTSPGSAARGPVSEASWYLAATGLWDSSLIPGGAFGAQFGAGYQWAPRWRAVALALVLPPQRTPVDTASSGATVDYAYTAGTVRACWNSATRLVFEGCAGAELGAVSARTVGFAEGQSQQSVFPSMAVTMGTGAEVGPAQLRFTLEGIVPLLRDRFTANEGALLVHETPRLSVRLSAGVIWPF
jgi:hypothetical protein